jgi:DNA modification methylase
VHDERNLAAIAASLSRFGQRLPIVVQRQGMIVRAGNGRMAAAKSLGWTHLACVVVDEASVDATAYAIADNRTSDLAAWDDETLASLLQSLPDDARLAAGYKEDELKALLDGLTSPEVVEDEPPAPLPEAVSRTGDLWVLGSHRLLCGDSTKAGDVEAVLGGERPGLCVTDPPYGVEYDPDWRNEAADKGLIAHAARRVGVVANDATVDWTAAWRLVPSDVMYCWHAGRHASTVAINLREAGFEIRNQVIWAKPRFAISRGHYHWQHEPCWYAVRKGKSSGWIGDRSQSTLWEISLDKNVDGGHSTQKPVECMARPIRNHESVGIYEPFCGSGTTLIAAEQLGRRCFAIEIEPIYVDVAVRRWEKLTGKQATLESTGKTWRETATERGVDVE